MTATTASVFESRCWSVAPDAMTTCEREHGHGGRHQRGGIYWEPGRQWGCAACEGDPESHGLHVCGKEPFG